MDILVLLLLCGVVCTVGHSHDHLEGILMKSLSPAAMKKKVTEAKESLKKIPEHSRQVSAVTIDESEILMEEVLESMKGVDEYFDSDVVRADGAPLKKDSFIKGKVKRQVDQQDIREALCKDKNPGEFFRLVAGIGNCRDVVACAEQGLQAIRCPPGLAFDLKKQTCEWRQAVKDCDVKSRPKLTLPQFFTSEPLCNRGELACGDGVCLPKLLFCDEKADCDDGSDENLCGSNDPNRAAECDVNECRLPDCFCSVDGKGIPGGLQPEQVPQMLVLTFDDAVNGNNFEVIDTLLNGNLKNPNGCDAKATFFLSHKYTNYSMVQELYRRGHEIASHSVSHDNDESYWDEGSKENWAAEMGDARDIAATWANVPKSEIFGARAPLLRLGGNRQYTALEEKGFVYDSSMVAPLSNPPYWPFPLSFASPHRCHGNFQKCPSRSHGIMEMVMNEFDPREEPGYVDEQVSGCAMLDSCSSIVTADGFYNVLTHNFIRHYEQNRAPMGLFLHAAWFKKQPEMLDAFIFWLEEILTTFDDVYLVTMKQVLAWMQQPVSTKTAAASFSPWKTTCTAGQQPDTCSVSHNCPLPSPVHGGLKQRMQTCNPCPAFYPWLGDASGERGALPVDLKEAKNRPLGGFS